MSSPKLWFPCTIPLMPRGTWGFRFFFSCCQVASSALPIPAPHLLMRSPNLHLGNRISQNFYWKCAKQDVENAQTLVMFWFRLKKWISILNTTEWKLLEAQHFDRNKPLFFNPSYLHLTWPVPFKLFLTGQFSQHPTESSNIYTLTGVNSLPDLIPEEVTHWLIKLLCTRLAYCI